MTDTCLSHSHSQRRHHRRGTAVIHVPDIARELSRRLDELSTHQGYFWITPATRPSPFFLLNGFRDCDTSPSHTMRSISRLTGDGQFEAMFPALAASAASKHHSL